MTKDEERESTTSSTQPDRVKEKIFKLPGERCTRGAWRRFFECTGQIFFLFEDQIFEIFRRMYFFRNLGPAQWQCPSPLLLPSWPTRSLPPFSTTLTSFSSLLRKNRSRPYIKMEKKTLVNIPTNNESQTHKYSKQHKNSQIYPFMF